LRASASSDPAARAAAAAGGPRRDWRSPAALRLHLGLVAGVSLCLFAGWFELTRALAGREVAWVYVFEWPLFAVIGCIMWWRLLAYRPARDGDEPGSGSQASGEPAPRATAHRPDDADPGLAAWQRYLAELQAADPPGGPPPRSR
jgi:hypothetical protein